MTATLNPPATTALQLAARAAYTRPDGGSTIPFERRSPAGRAYWEGVAQRAVAAAVEHAQLGELFAYLHYVQLLEDGWWTCGCGQQLTQADEEASDFEKAHFEEVVRDALLGDGAAAWSSPPVTCPDCVSTDVVLRQQVDRSGTIRLTIVDCRACGEEGMVSREDQDHARVVGNLVAALIETGLAQRNAPSERTVGRLAHNPLDAARVAQWLRAAHQAGREAGRQECQDEHTD